MPTLELKSKRYVLWPKRNLKQIVVDLEDVASFIVRERQNVLEMDDFACPTDQELVLVNRFSSEHSQSKRQSAQHNFGAQVAKGGMSEPDGIFRFRHVQAPINVSVYKSRLGKLNLAEAISRCSGYKCGED